MAPSEAPNEAILYQDLVEAGILTHPGQHGKTIRSKSELPKYILQEGNLKDEQRDRMNRELKTIVQRIKDANSLDDMVALENFKSEAEDEESAKRKLIREVLAYKDSVALKSKSPGLNQGSINSLL